MSDFKAFGKIRHTERDAEQLAEELRQLATMTGRLDRGSRAELHRIVRAMRHRCGDTEAGPLDMLR